MKYGKEQTTRFLDDQVSTETREENMVNGEIANPVRKHYEIKERVHNQREEHEAYMRFSDEVVHDPHKLDPSFQIRRTAVGDDKGYYLVVHCYTVLEHV